MARISVLAIIALFAVLVLAAHDLKVRDTPRGHDAIAKRKRAAINETDTTPPPSEDDGGDVDDTTPPPADDATPIDERASKSKACLAWSNVIPAGLKHATAANPFGMYTWSPWCPDQKDRGKTPCFPMLWGYKSIGQFKSIKKGSVSHVLGPNECNQPGQSQMSPGSAISLWKQYMIPHHNAGSLLVSPSISNSKTGVPWLQQFFKDPTVSKSTHAVAAHWYGTKAQNFIDYMTNLHHSVGNRTIWVTECACNDFSHGTKCSATQAMAMMKTIKAWMDKTPWIETYCWFGAWHSGKAGVSASNALLNSDGTLNALGKTFFY